MSTKFEIVTHTKSELTELQTQTWIWNQPDPPFSRLKLEQYLANPVAEADDVLLLTVSESSAIIAYLLIIPDLVSINGEPCKAVWPSSWWVKPKFRGKGLADALMLKVYELYPRMLINSGTPQALHKVQKQGLMTVLSERPRCLRFFNLNPDLLAFMNRASRINLALLPLVRPCLKMLFRARLNSWRAGLPPLELQTEHLTIPDAETYTFLRPFWTKDLSFKNPEIFSWRLHNSVHAPQLKGLPPLYRTYFGNLGYRHLNYIVKLYHRKRMVGFVNLIISDGMLKFPYFYLQSGMEAQFCAWLAELLRHNPVDAIYCQNPQVNSILDSFHLPALYTKSYPMPVLVSKQLSSLAPGQILQDGDGAF
jgi:hypothetical protein